MSQSASRYVLGADPDEFARLEHQHGVWRFLGERVFDALGIGEGWKVLDAGCGPGLVLADLRARIGESGEAWGVDVSPVMLAEAQRRFEAQGWRNGSFLEADLLEAELPRDHFDLIWCRWVLSFPPDPGAILARLARALKPGGHLAVIDYDHDGVGLFTESEAFRAMIRATRQLYRDAGGDPWVGARLPALYRAAGLELTAWHTDVLAGGPGEPAFEWATRFFPPWAQRFVDKGLITPAERDALLADWSARAADPDARFFSPILVTAVGRRPD